MPTETETEATDALDIDPEVKDIVLQNDLLQNKDIELADASEVKPISDAGLEMASKSLLEIGLLMHSHSRVLDSAKEALAAAQATFNRISARMNFLTDQEHDARMLEYLPALEAAEEAALNAARQVGDQCRAIAEATSFPREMQLSSEDTARAASLREFVREDCTELTLAELQVKLQKAAASGDAVQAWLYTRYGTQRVSGPITENPYQAEDGQTLYRVTPAMLSAQQQCQELIKYLGSRLSESRIPKLNVQSKEIMQKTRELSQEATARRSQVELQRMRTSPSYNLL